MRINEDSHTGKALEPHGLRVRPLFNSVKNLGQLVLVTLLLASCVKRTPCDQTDGADVCSMVPAHYACECKGTLEPATADEQSICGKVKTVCVGEVRRDHIPAVAPGLPQMLNKTP